MTLRTYDHLMNKLYNTMNYFDGDRELTGFLNNDYMKSPRQNTEVYPEKYVYTFDVPGVKKEDITIKENNGMVTIKGVRKDYKADEKTNYKYVESHYGSFSRTFKLDKDTIPEQMNAHLTDGVLRLTVGRKQDNVAANERSVSIV